MSYSPIQGRATRLLPEALRGVAVPPGPWDCLGRDLLLVVWNLDKARGGADQNQPSPLFFFLPALKSKASDSESDFLFL